MNLFLLDAVTGELRTAKPLDKEALDNPEGIITLSIKAREIVDGTKGDDPLTVTTTEAIIKIKDVNDEPPTFNRRDYYVEIPENIPEGSPLPNLDIFVEDTDTVLPRFLHPQPLFLHSLLFSGQQFCLCINVGRYIRRFFNRTETRKRFRSRPHKSVKQFTRLRKPKST